MSYTYRKFQLPQALREYDFKNEAEFRRLIEDALSQVSVQAPPTVQVATVLFHLDNGVDELQDAQWVSAVVTFPFTIKGYRLIEDCGIAGDLELKVEYATNTAFPTWTEISGSNRPTLTSAREVESTNLAAWSSTSGAAYSQLRAVVVGAATSITRAVLALELEKV